MQNLLESISSYISPSLRNVAILLFLALLGSHYLDYHILLFVVIGTVLISWREILGIGTVLVLLFLFSLYGMWSYLDPRILHEVTLANEVFSRGLLVATLYFMGYTLPLDQDRGSVVMTKRLFYLFYLFFIGYLLVLAWSYFFIAQDQPLTSKGMFVDFPNPYQRSYVNGGRLISTILTYYLTAVAMLLPFLLLFVKRFRQKGFYRLELLLLIILSLFALYLAALMGRRTTFVLLFVVSLFLSAVWIAPLLKKRKFYLILFVVLTAVTAMVYQIKDHPRNEQRFQAVVVSENIVVPIEAPKRVDIHYLMAKLEGIPAFHRLVDRGLSDSRFQVWIKGLEVMMAYPFGGGHPIYLNHLLRLAHNTWIDIGKDFGVVPFLLFVSVSLWHLYLLARLLLSVYVEPLLKYLLIVLALSLFAIMMIEPVFNSDKTFFAYLFFYFGVIANIYRKIRVPKVS